MLFRSIILDACCVLNFSASGSFSEILRSLPAQVIVTQVVRERELISLQRLSEETGEAANQFEAAIDLGLLLVEDFANDREAPHLQILSSLDIIKHWSELTNAAPGELRRVLSNIRTRGRYAPHRSHPLLAWWQAAIE